MNESEFAVKTQLENDGWTVLRSGWPDFLCRKRKIDGWEYKSNGGKGVG